MVVYQNVDVVSLRDPGPILTDHPVRGKGSRPGVLGLMTLVKAFNYSSRPQFPPAKQLLTPTLPLSQSWFKDQIRQCSRSLWNTGYYGGNNHHLKNELLPAGYWQLICMVLNVFLDKEIHTPSVAEEETPPHTSYTPLFSYCTHETDG